MTFQTQYMNILNQLKSIIQGMGLVDSNNVRIGVKVELARPPFSYIFIEPSTITLPPKTIEPTYYVTARFNIIYITSIVKTDTSSLESEQQSIMENTCKIIDTLLSDLTLNNTCSELRVLEISPETSTTPELRMFSVTITIETDFYYTSE